MLSQREQFSFQPVYSPGNSGCRPGINQEFWSRPAALDPEETGFDARGSVRDQQGNEYQLRIWDHRCQRTGDGLVALSALAGNWAVARALSDKPNTDFYILYNGGCAMPAGRVVVCLDEIGPQASKSDPGQPLVRASEGERATQEIDYGRRDVAGYVFGAPELVEGPAGHGSGVYDDL